MFVLTSAFLVCLTESVEGWRRTLLGLFVVGALVKGVDRADDGSVIIRAAKLLAAGVVKRFCCGIPPG